MQEDSSFKKDLEESIVQRKFNRKELRRRYGGARSGYRSKAPRHIASRKAKPAPKDWKGWKSWDA